MLINIVLFVFFCKENISYILNNQPENIHINILIIGIYFSIIVKKCGSIVIIWPVNIFINV